MHHGGIAGCECQVVPKVGTQRERNAGAFLAVTFLFKCGPWTPKSVTTFSGWVSSHQFNISMKTPLPSSPCLSSVKQRLKAAINPPTSLITPGTTAYDSGFVSQPPAQSVWSTARP